MPIAYGISVGGSLNYAHEQLDDVTYQSGYLDLGALYRQPGQWWSVGAVLQNAGLPVAGYSLPLTMRLGGAARFFKDELNITADIVRTFPGWYRYGLGAEYWYRNLFALRAGYFYRPEQEGLDSLSGLRAGLGFNIQGYQLDYALIPQGDLGYGHRASFTYFFGGGRALVSEKQALISKARQKGQTALQAESYAEAIDHYQKVLTFQPNDVQAAQNLEKAKAGLRTQERRAELISRFAKADHYRQNKQYTDAMDEYQRILLIDAGNTSAAKALDGIQKKYYAKEIQKKMRAGRAAFKREQWADALLACQGILAIAATHQEAKEMLAKTRQEMAKGSKRFKDPRIQEWYLAGLTRFGKGDYYGAIQKWNMVLKKAPKHKNARKYKSEAIRLRADQITKWIADGKRYLGSGDLVKAASRWRKILKVSPGHAKAKSLLRQNEAAFRVLAKKHYVQGIQDYTLSQLKQAIANWQDTLTLIPDYPGAQENIKKARTKQKALQ
ncbi:hypothetical protein K8S19_09180 [bacterium]|nr:hypothetical protein [bacterium]